MLKFTVTGNRFEVQESCNSRGLVAFLIGEDGNKTCTMSASDDNLATIRTWQQEFPRMPPYPPGTCLCVFQVP